MTHPDLVTYLLSAWVCLAFVVFIVAHMLLLSKRIVAWFDRQRELSHPPSVQYTLNQLNITADEKAAATARHTRIDSGG
jgi:hypothetical protein